MLGLGQTARTERNISPQVSTGEDDTMVTMDVGAKRQELKDSTVPCNRTGARAHSRAGEQAWGVQVEVSTVP